jgi:hypothetical protein
MLLENTKNAVIDLSASGDNTIITCPDTDKYIAIDHINFLVETAVDLTFKSGSTAISGTYTLDAKQAIALDNACSSQKGVINCSAGEDFVITLSAAVQVSGFVRYRIIG